MLLSIVIPAYNVEKYLDDCLASCFRQDIPTSDYEVIVVNDGSKDGTLRIAERWASEYTNIKVISQSNKGLSEARNAGMAASGGEFIMFIDSDDWIADNCLGKIIGIFRSTMADMVRMKAVKIVGGKTHVITAYTDDETASAMSGRDLLKKKFNVTAQLSVYRKSYLESRGLRFYPGIFHEDNEFSPRAYYYAERIASTNEVTYFVRQTPGSITRSVNPKKIHDLIMVVERLADFARNEVEPTYSRFIWFQAGLTLNWAIKETRKLDKSQRKEVYRKLLQKRTLFRYIIKSPALLHKLEGIIISILFMFIPGTLFRRFTESVHKGLEKAVVGICGETTVGYKLVYFLRARKRLDMHNPKNLNEKLFWLARYWRNPLITKCADKYLVREYLIEKGCEDILNELYGVYDKAEDIPFDTLPQKFVLKCNHGSHMNIICEDKSNLDKDAAARQLDKWLKVEYGRGYEWQYRPIPRKIVAEKYIESADGKMTEYQIFCFNGQPQFFLVRNDLRNSEADKEGMQYAVSYTMDWKRVYMRKGEEKFQFELPKPKNYHKMIDYAIRLSADFPQVRVDYYEIDDKLIFGELTFSSNGNVQSNYKKEYIDSLGEKLQLPERY